jgi:hypothetical protein
LHFITVQAISNLSSYGSTNFTPYGQAIRAGVEYAAAMRGGMVSQRTLVGFGKKDRGLRE